MFVNCMQSWSLEFGKLTGRPYNFGEPQLKPVRRHKTQSTIRNAADRFQGEVLKASCNAKLKVDSKQWSLQVPVAVIVTNSPEQREAALDALLAAGME